MIQPVLPGATLGVLGSGQLGRMFAIAARRLGYRVHVLSPDSDTPTGQVADVEIRADYEDLDAIAAFARGVSVVTFEFENVPLVATQTAERFAPVRPNGAVLHTTQNRAREKNFLKQAGIPLAEFATVNSLTELHEAVTRIGYPAVLKTAEWGYDGKGQAKIVTPADVETAWKRLATSAAVLEAFVDFECEASALVARGVDGHMATYGPFSNSHAHHILDVSILPGRFSPHVADRAIEIARQICQRLEAIGVLCVEFFITHSGDVIVNEIAPRPHNSGHLTIDACVTCQFEQQVRAICGLPLGSSELLRPAAMANLLGDLWNPTVPNWDRLLRFGDAKLHLYGKRTAQPGRKMGHITALADTSEQAERIVRQARQELSAPSLE